MNCMYLLEASASLKKSNLKSNNHIKLLLSSPLSSFRFFAASTDDLEGCTRFGTAVLTTFGGGDSVLDCGLFPDPGEVL